MVWLLLNKTPSTLPKAELSASTVISVRLEQPPNALNPMLVTPSAIVTLIRLVQSWNAKNPMLVTLLGIETLVRLLHKANALSPMLVTGRPSIVLGMVSAPPEQVYP